MNIRTLKFEHLTDGQVAAWSALQRACAAFSSPFFRPEFTQLVASVRSDVEVAVLEEAGTPVGFFPFQRTFFNAGQPIGNGMCDYQGLIAPAEIQCDPLELLRACGLSSWRFDHLVPVHASFERYAWSSAESPYIDLSDGLEGYLDGRENGIGILAEYRRKQRRIEREVGPIRYEPHVPDLAVLATCIQWKGVQYRRMGFGNPFDNAWTAKLLHRILDYRGEGFAAAMPVYYAGDRIAAINFGIRSGDEFHSWFPTYDPDLAGCSPGYLHFIEMMKAAESLGIRRIDLGRGTEPYKQRLMSGANLVAEGAIDKRSSAAIVRRAWRIARERIRRSPLAVPARMPKRLARQVKHWLAAP